MLLLFINVPSYESGLGNRNDLSLESIVYQVLSPVDGTGEVLGEDKLNLNCSKLFNC